MNEKKDTPSQYESIKLGDKSKYEKMIGDTGPTYFKKSKRKLIIGVLVTIFSLLVIVPKLFSFLESLNSAVYENDIISDSNNTITNDLNNNSSDEYVLNLDNNTIKEMGNFAINYFNECNHSRATIISDYRFKDESSYRKNLIWDASDGNIVFQISYNVYYYKNDGNYSNYDVEDSYVYSKYIDEAINRFNNDCLSNNSDIRCMKKFNNFYLPSLTKSYNTTSFDTFYNSEFYCCAIFYTIEKDVEEIQNELYKLDYYSNYELTAIVYTFDTDFYNKLVNSSIDYDTFIHNYKNQHRLVIFRKNS